MKTLPKIKLEHGKTYENGEGSLILIKREKWHHAFAGYSEKGVFMGYYNDFGTSYENPCYETQLWDIEKTS